MERFSMAESPYNGNSFLTIAEAADFLRIGRTSMFGLIRNGTVQTVKLSSRMVRITLDQLLNLAEQSGYFSDWELHWAETEVKEIADGYYDGHIQKYENRNGLSR